MQQRSTNIWATLDYPTIALYLVLIVCGFLCIYSSNYDIEQATDMFSLSTRVGKQLLWMGICFIAAITIILIDERVYDLSAYILYTFIILVLLATPFVGSSVRGSNSWLSIGSIAIQPAEFAKFITAITLARFVSGVKFSFQSTQDALKMLSIIILPMLIIGFWQRELGTAIVFLAFFLALYRFGMSRKIFLLGFYLIFLFIVSIKYNILIENGDGTTISLLLVCIIANLCCGIYDLLNNNSVYGKWIIFSTILIYAILFILKNWIALPLRWIILGIEGFIAIIIIVQTAKKWDFKYLLAIIFIVGSIASTIFLPKVFEHLPRHQKNRIEVFLRMKEDPQGVEYNTRQSLIAIGSGQFKGKGFLEGTQTTLKYLPESDTDYIFCTVGEQFGFIGSVFVLGIYLAFILRLIKIAERQRKKFENIYGYCVVYIFLFHFTINVGMVLGLLPVIGIPLPFFSYGGSSLLGSTRLLFILLRFDATRLTKLQ